MVGSRFMFIFLIFCCIFSNSTKFYRRSFFHVPGRYERVRTNQTFVLEKWRTLGRSRFSSDSSVGFLPSDTSISVSMEKAEGKKLFIRIIAFVLCFSECNFYFNKTVFRRNYAIDLYSWATLHQRSTWYLERWVSCLRL